MTTRTETDPLGDLEVPADALYGVQTQRAVDNFDISGIGPHPAFVWATVVVKKAAAIAHRRTGRLEAGLADAIVQAADEVLTDGRHQDQFVVDVFQAGAGTSHNMNANELLANRANELLGGERGAYAPVHPNDHVNMAQSTNDIIPTAIALAALKLLQDLYVSLDGLAEAFEEKARDWDGIVKSGRTHLQDATPVRLGQEFGAYAEAIRRDAAFIRDAEAQVQELSLGGTAVGSGLNAEPEYQVQVIDVIGEITGLEVRRADNLFYSMQSMARFAMLSGAVRALAIDLSRIANDFRLLASGPRTGISELRLPALQPGSSIMPGKVNPVMAECLNMVCFHVFGNDAAVQWAAEAGQLELNVMMPCIAYNLCQSPRGLDECDAGVRHARGSRSGGGRPHAAVLAGAEHHAGDGPGAANRLCGRRRDRQGGRRHGRRRAGSRGAADRRPTRRAGGGAGSHPHDRRRRAGGRRRRRLAVRSPPNQVRGRLSGSHGRLASPPARRGSTESALSLSKGSARTGPGPRADRDGPMTE